MSRTRSVLACVVFVCALVLAAPVRGAERDADVRTWTGETWRLAQPTFEVFYTIMPPESNQQGTAAPPTMGGASSAGQRLSAAFQAQGPSLGGGAGKAVQGRRWRTTITVTRDGVDVQVPIDRIETLVFTRAPVTTNLLPPYVAPTQLRYAARVELTDGSVVEADYVNLGTTILRGITGHGRVDVPWDAIESVTFSAAAR
jgi:hypothetical protein